MKVTNEKTENRQTFLTVEMEPAEVEASLESACQRLARKTDIPGFRRGKAPRAVLERYLGRDRLLEEALSNLVPEASATAITEQGLEAFAQPHIELAQTDPVVFKLAVPLAPTIKLGDYHQIRVKAKPATVKGADIDATLEQLRHQHATWEPAERPVTLNDLVLLDVASTIEDKPFINQKGAQYQVIHELPLPAPGFAEQLVGMGRDEAKEFRLQFPADYPRGELAGKEALFKVKVTEIKQEKLPELNDELARGISPEVESLDSLREKVTTELRLRAEEEARLDFEEQVIAALVEAAEVEFPPIMVEIETDRIIEQQMRRWQTGSLKEYLSLMKKTEAELREGLKPTATKRVTGALALGRVAEEEKLEVSEDEINAEIENMTKGATEKKEELARALNTPQARQSIKPVLLTRKTVERLVAIAKSKTKTPTRRRTKKKEEKNE